MTDFLKSFFIFIGLFTLVAIIFFFYNLFYRSGFSESSERSKHKISEDTKTGNFEIEPPNENDVYKIKSINAKYTVINYFSLDCIHCQRLWRIENTEENKKILEGKVNLIYRETSLFSQPLSGEKQIILECLKVDSNRDMNLYYRFIDRIYSSGEYINTQTNNNWIKEIVLSEYVKNKQNFTNCIESQDNKNKVQNIKNKHLIQGIKMTPTLFIFDKEGNLIKKHENVGGSVGWKILEALAK